MRFLITLLAFAFLVPTEMVFSQVVYKCTDASGAVVFAQTPCATNAEAVVVEESSSGFLPPARQESIYERAEQEFEQYNNESAYRNGSGVKGRSVSDPNHTLDGRDKRQVKAQRERERELDKAIRNVRGTGAEAERIRVELALAKAQGRSMNDPERKRILNKAIRNVRGSGAMAERLRSALEAAKYGSITSSHSIISRTPERHTQTTPAHTIPAHPIPSSRAGFYIPTGPDGSQYIAPGGGMCNKEGIYLNCAGTLKHANGVVVEPNK